MGKMKKKDMEKHRKAFESDEHWELKKSFMETHRNKFSEDELLCLAQVFVNVEFLGCKYPLETMQQVQQLIQEVPQILKYRESRRNKLKRTFVGAQDASQAKFSKTTAKRKLENEAKPQKHKMMKFNESQQFDNIQQLLKDVVIFEMHDDDAISSFNKTTSVMKNTGKLEIKFDEGDGAQKKYSYNFEGQIIGEGVGGSKKAAKREADKNLMETLKANCYTLKSKVLFYSPENVIQKDKKGDDKSKKSDNSQIQENNLGFKMLKMLGWKGGSLGSKGEGIIDPVNCKIKIGRKGLGADSSDEFDFKYFKNLLRNFKNSEVEYDLVFSSEFTKEERAQIHQFATSINLRTKSFGKNESRHIVVSTKLTTPELLRKLHEGDQHLLEKYDVIEPTKLRLDKSVAGSD